MDGFLPQPLSPEDYSGEVHHYVISLANDQKQDVTCTATLSQCSVQVPAEVQALSVSAVTSYGTSPPAHVPLRPSGTQIQTQHGRPSKTRWSWKKSPIKCKTFCLGGFVPVLRNLAPAVNGSAVLVSWSWPGTKQQSTSGEELLHYVVEWTSVPAAQLQWHEMAKDPNSTSITGMAHLPFRHSDNTAPVPPHTDTHTQ